MEEGEQETVRGRIRIHSEVHPLPICYSRHVGPFPGLPDHPEADGASEGHALSQYDPGPVDLRRADPVRRHRPADGHSADGRVAGLFHFAKGVLESEFRKTVAKRAKSVLRTAMVNELGIINGIALASRIEGKDLHKAMGLVKGVIELKNVNKWIKLLEHYYDAPDFNIRSSDQMRRWLFDVEELTPIKSTNQKAKGMPSQSWEKVLELPTER